MKMKLHCMPGACSLAAHIVLEWIGTPYEIEIHAHDQLHQPAYLRVNPQGAVPALEVDGDVITQNAGVLTYLGESHPEAKLLGDGSPRSAAEVHRWLGFINSDLHPAFKPLFGATRYLGDEAMIEKTRANARETVHRLFERLDAQLKGRDWIAGTAGHSLADAYLYALTRWTQGVGVDIGSLQELARFVMTMNADPAVQRALKAEGLS